MNEQKPVVTNDIPDDWTSEQEILAKEALRTLYRHYSNWRWGVEWSKCANNQLGVMIIRLLDVPTKTVYLINPKDIDRDRMTCAMRAGGTLLEAHGIKVGAARGDQIRGLKKTPAGLIVPDYGAVPENNPGYAEIMRDSKLLR